MTTQKLAQYRCNDCGSTDIGWKILQYQQENNIVPICYDCGSRNVERLP